jgi:hypothetical protein
MNETKLDTEPYFSDEAQEVFTEKCRVFTPKGTLVVRESGKGTYLGRTRHGALVAWDTPDGNGYRESVPFNTIKNLYR